MRFALPGAIASWSSMKSPKWESSSSPIGVSKDSNYIIIRYLDSGFFLEKDGTAPTEWQQTAADRTAAFDYDVR